MSLTSAWICTLPVSMIVARSISEENPSRLRSEDIVMDALIDKSKHFTVIIWISLLIISSISTKSMTFLSSIHWTRGTAPKEGFLIALLMHHQMDFYSLCPIVWRILLYRSLFPDSFAWIKQSRRWTQRSPPAWLFKVLNFCEHASIASKHWSFVGSRGRGIPAFKASLTVLLWWGPLFSVFLAKAWHARHPKWIMWSGLLNGKGVMKIWQHLCSLLCCISTIWLSRHCIFWRASGAVG